MGERLCLVCGAGEAIRSDERMLPPGWSCLRCSATTKEHDGIALLAPDLADQEVGIDPRAFDYLRQAEDQHFWFRARNRLIVGLVHMHFPDADSVLEVGCGNGTVLDAMQRARPYRRIVGTELHPAALKHAKKRLPDSAELVQMDARAIAFRNAFDLVGAFDVLEHIEEDEAVLVQLAQAVRPGGGVILSVPQHPSLWSGADDAAFHVRRYRLKELEEKVSRAGLRVIDSTSYMTLLLPLMLVSRLFDRSRKGDLSSLLQREFEISAGTNMFLGAITSMEVVGTLAGLRWPVGGSRVVVAVK